MTYVISKLAMEVSPSLPIFIGVAVVVLFGFLIWMLSRLTLIHI